MVKKRTYTTILLILFCLTINITKAEELETAAETTELSTDESLILQALEKSKGGRNIELTDEEKAALQSNLILSELNDRLFSSQRFYRNLREKIDKTKDKVETLTEEVDEVKKDLAYLTMQIQETTQKINNINKKIAFTENQILKKYNEIDLWEVQQKEQVNALSDYFMLLYFQKNKFFTSDNNINVAKLFLASTSVSQTLQEETYFNILEQTGDEILGKVTKITKTLENEKKQLDLERAKLAYLDMRLKNEQATLKEQEDDKKSLLSETKERRDIFQKMLVQSVEQKELAEKEIAALRNNITYFDEKVSKVKSVLTPQEYEEILKIKAEMQAQKSEEKENNEFKFEMWPIMPSNGLSAYFIDPLYKARFGVEHYAIDIRAPQGTPVRAPEDGIILRAMDNGAGYSYIVMAFRHNMLGVFGHISKMFINNTADDNLFIDGFTTYREGEFVHAGDVIGLSGGAVGAPGSGLRTTGPHLHFETWEKGIKVDPLQYLPIEFLPIEYIPTEYLKNIEVDIMEIMKELK